MSRRNIKIAVASIAFIPMIVVVLAFGLQWLGALKGVEDNPFVIGCVLYHFPALSLAQLAESFQCGRVVFILVAFVAMLGWSTLIAAGLWKVAATFQGEEEPGGLDNGGKFDWVRFQTRFCCGFVLGSLVGWRLVKSTHSMKTMFIASLIAGVVVGFVLGLTRPPDFWSRGF